MKRKILVAGLGLIGGSIAKGIAMSEENHVIGYDTNKESLKYALENGIIHESYTCFTEASMQADIIFLAAPISETIKLMHQLNDISFDHEVIVTDVSSVKGSILKTAQELTNPNITFIGGHPMAGSHKDGVRAAKAHLFENAIYVLTPTQKCSEVKISILKDVLKQTKSRFLILEPQEHDEMTSVISHFPHLIASSLVHQARKWEDRHAYLPELAAGGFRDITRIASSNPKMWQDIFYHNGNKMLHLLDDWISEMSTLKDIIKNNNKEQMINYLDEAKHYRDGLPTKRGALPSYFDIYVDIQDKPGTIASVVQLLARENISITNIQILEIRNDILGVLRLTLPRKEEQMKSYQLLMEHGYEVTIEA